MVLKTIKIVFTKSEMRTNADRVRFNGDNLNETRTRKELMAEEEAAKAAAKAAEQAPVEETKE